MFLEKQYEIIKDYPKAIDWEEYCNKIIEEYNNLLSSTNDELTFQTFFEENPSFVPGAFELFGSSGHYPYMDALISQPEIGTLFQRKPDFVWLSQDSLSFCPVFIEIENPNKKMFNKNGTTTADFNQALNQLREWQYILNQTNNIQVLYDYFNLPIDIRKKTFNPQFLLIYGRRFEYENDDLLTGIRAAHKTDKIDIISYDRLTPSYDSKQLLTCKMMHGKYRVINIPPTFNYIPLCANTLSQLINFKERINDMKYTSESRKKFLVERYQYWYSFGKLKSRGLIRSNDCE